MLNALNILKSAMANKEKIAANLNSSEGKTYVKDTTYWTVPYDLAKKQGSATIAFLPFADMFTDPENGETSPYIFLPEHGELKGTKGKKYFGILCKSVKGERCPICEKFFELYNGTEEEKAIAMNLGLSRKRYYHGNIIVIKNTSNPDEVGKIFKYKFGVSIKEKINKKVSPIDDDEQIMVYDPMNIMPMKISVKEKGGFRNFDDSEWVSSQKNLAEYFIKTDSEDEKNTWIIENVIDKLYSVKDFVTDDSYRSEEELDNIINDVFVNNNMIQPVAIQNKPVVSNKKLGTEIKQIPDDDFEDDSKKEEIIDDSEDDFDKIFKD